MPTLHERIETTLPLTEAFAFVGDFANAAAWDPGVADSQRVDGGPIVVGSRYHLAVRMGGRTAPMVYMVTTFEPERRVVLHGSGSGVQAEDAIDFDAVGGRTIIDYTATIRLVGMRHLIEPFLGGAFRRIAREARDGMQAVLDRQVAMALASSAVPSPVDRSSAATQAAT